MHPFPGPTSDLSTETESFWLSVSDGAGLQYRYGVNPYNAVRAYLVHEDGSEEVVEETPFQSDACQRSTDGDGDVSGWSCSLRVPFSQLLSASGGPVRIQMIHAHVTVAAEEGDTTFYAVLCPGGAEEGGFDWVGCETDPRSLIQA